MITRSNRDVDAAAEQLTTDATVTSQIGFILQGGPANATGLVYVSTNPSLTAGTADATDGFPLAAGQSEFFPVKKASDLYVFGSTTNLVVFFYGL